MKESLLFLGNQLFDLILSYKRCFTAQENSWKAFVPLNILNYNKNLCSLLDKSIVLNVLDKKWTFRILKFLQKYMHRCHYVAETLFRAKCKKINDHINFIFSFILLIIPIILELRYLFFTLSFSVLFTGIHKGAIIFIRSCLNKESLFTCFVIILILELILLKELNFTTIYEWPCQIQKQSSIWDFS